MHVYRDEKAFIEIQLDEQSRFRQSLMGQEFVSLRFSLEDYVEFLPGDYVLHRGKKYTLKSAPQVHKVNAVHYDYQLSLESDLSKLYDVLFLLDGKSEFFLYADAQKFLHLIIENLKRIYGVEAYQVGDSPKTPVKNLRFSDQNVYQALQQVCREFSLEYEWIGNKLRLCEAVGKDTGLVLEFRKGLRGIERLRYDNEGLITRLYPYGGKKNITSSYRHGAERLQLSEGFLEKNTKEFGIIEAVKTFEEIYPHREGKVTAIDRKDPLIFSDDTMDFDLNEQLIPGTTPKVTFNSGALGGYELEIHAYNPEKKEFDLVGYEDERGTKRPDEHFKIKVGDTYVIHDIMMPEVYVKKAEEALGKKAREYLERYSQPKVEYRVTSDYVWLRRNKVELSVGDVITLREEDFNLEIKTRLTSINQNMANVFDYDITIADEVSVGLIGSFRRSQRELRNNISIEAAERSKYYNRNRKNLGELKRKVFDPDGYFDPQNIKPFSIETGMLSVGMKGQQFIIENLLIEPNFLGNKNVVRFGAGTLVHFTIAEEPRRWTLPAFTVDLSDDGQAYYLYARCSKEGQGGVFFVSEKQFKTQGDTVDYYFLLGVIHSVQEGVRGVSLTYGQTTVNGRFITTGRIKSQDGYNFIDLDGNQFAIGNGQSGLDWNVSEKDTLTVKGAIIQKGQVADWVIDEGKITSRDKAATLDSKEGKFSIQSGQGVEGRIEVSKDGLYSGHAGIDLKVDGRDVKAAVIGQRGSDSPNAFGGVFQGLLAQGLHLSVKTIKDTDLIQTESYAHEIYRQPYESYDSEDKAVDFSKYSSYIDSGICIFPEPEDSLQKKYWNKVTLDRFNISKGFITAAEEGQVEISGVMDMGGVRDGEIELFIGDEKSIDQKKPIKVFSVKKNSEFIKNEVKKIVYNYRSYKIQERVSVKAGDKIIFRHFPTYTSGFLQKFEIRFNPKNETENSNGHIIYKQPEGDVEYLAFGFTEIDGYKGPAGIYGFPEPLDSSEKKHWNKVTLDRFKVGRGFITAPEEGQMEISGVMEIIGIRDDEIGLYIGDEKDIDQKKPIKVFSPKENSKFIKTDVEEKYFKFDLYKIQAKAQVKPGDKIIFKGDKWFVSLYNFLSDVKICFKHK